MLRARMKPIFIVALLLGVLLIASCNLTGGTVSDNDPCLALEGAAKDNCFAEKLRCSQVQSLIVRDNCVAELARKKVDLKVCDLITSDKTKGYCQEQVALITNNQELCGDISDQYWKDNCNSELAIKNNKDVFCSLISIPSQREDCYRTIAINTNNGQLCEFLATKEKDGCLYKIAGKIMDLKLCNDVSTPVGQDACRMKVARVSNDKEKCKTIKISSIREMCDSYFK